MYEKQIVGQNKYKSKIFEIALTEIDTMHHRVYGAKDGDNNTADLMEIDVLI